MDRAPVLHGLALVVGEGGDAVAAVRHVVVLGGQHEEVARALPDGAGRRVAEGPLDPHRLLGARRRVGPERVRDGRGRGPSDPTTERHGEQEEGKATGKTALSVQDSSWMVEKRTAPRS
ncbi:hypothetical protein D3C87_1828780 [compost metagenome]